MSKMDAYERWSTKCDEFIYELESFEEFLPLLQEEYFRSISFPEYLDSFSPYNSDDNEELDNYLPNVSMPMCDSRNKVGESYAIKPDVRDYNAAITSNPYHQNDVQSLASLLVHLNAEYTPANESNIRESFSCNAPCISEILGSFSPYNSEDNAELDNYLPNASMEMCDSESEVGESDIIKPNMLDCIEATPSTSYDQNDVQSAYSLSASLNAEKRSVVDLSIRDNSCHNVSYMPANTEDSVSGIANTPTTMSNISNCGFLQQHRDDSAQTFFKMTSQEHDAKSTDIRRRGEFSVSSENTLPVAGPSGANANTQDYLKDGRYVCPECGKDFLFKIYFQKHYQIHTGERCFSCDLCEERFLRKHHLTRHRLKHKGAKP